MTSRSSALVLVGPMGTGKTSVGRRVAKALGTTFYDTDVAIAREHGPIPEIFEREGEPRFRALERAAVLRGLENGGVVALGGGAILDASTRADLAHHRVALLSVEPRVVAGRLRGTTRPLLQGAEAMSTWSRISAERAPLYAEVADAVFDTSSGPLRHVVAAIVVWAREGAGT